MTEKLSTAQREQTIADNLRFIEAQIGEAAEKSGRTRSDIRLMAVTKTVEPVFINHAIACGVDLIGENKVQEFLGKQPYLKLDHVEAHLIGHLQTNKVRQIVPYVSMIQSVDSLKLAKEIDKQCEKIGKTMDCLIEVNIAGEESKTGLPPEKLEGLLAEMAQMPHVRVRGLMTIPPICDENDKLCGYFQKMHAMFVDIGRKNIDNISMQILSMGMSSDYALAIECGANLVRIGSSIFGPRLY